MKIDIETKELVEFIKSVQPPAVSRLYEPDNTVAQCVDGNQRILGGTGVYLEYHQVGRLIDIVLWRVGSKPRINELIDGIVAEFEMYSATLRKIAYLFRERIPSGMVGVRRPLEGERIECWLDAAAQFIDAITSNYSGKPIRVDPLTGGALDGDVAICQGNDKIVSPSVQ